MMGEPITFYEKDGKNILVWQMDAFASCSVVLGDGGNVEAKSCYDNIEARSNAQAMALQYYMRRQQSQQDQPHQVPIYQPARPVQTSCRSYGLGHEIQTNCTSQSTGIDTSIYH